MTRLLTGLAAVLLLSLPASAGAATTFGSRLDHEPSNSGECTDFGVVGCSLVSFIHPIDPSGGPYSGGAPSDGVIVKFRIRAFGEGNTAATVTFLLADISRPDPNNADTAVARLVASGPTVTLQPTQDGLDTPIREFAARVPVKKGNHLGLNGTNVWATVNNSGDKFTYVYSPPLVAGQGPRGNTDAKGELLVAAVMEPDVDGDGFGDESQDGCPTDPTTNAGCPAQDTTAPRLGSLGLFPRVFASKRGARVPVGTLIRYTLTEPAVATFKVFRKRPGRRVRGRCVRPRRTNRSRPRCSRYVRLRGKLTREGVAGENSFRWNGKLRGRALPPGRYRLDGQARDAAGNVSALRSRSFRIVAP